ncbi:MAG: proton-conducting transporter membrane subunit [Sulfuricurvum sp.]|uniref:proton-conducting transporter transmembrane domain-containing protein n=1 Tax=Sulfuricurvum sp. TaxID=2025608 RepID=UPI00260DD18C|nr:proton-conducting transporter membrane subunit [Sulfuricurvum sp.]MDD5159163.1 proton-conducting transporter membrane subunit [Sulfuricurvum sp.]
MLLTLILLPIATAFLILYSSTRIQYLLSAAVLGVGSFLSVSLFMSTERVSFHLPFLLNAMIIAADLVLLIYFLVQGKKFNSPKVIVLAAAQLLLYIYAEYAAPSGRSAEIVVDELSRFMFLIINIVGGIIVLYSVRYMEDESVEPYKKRHFIAAMLLFLSVMNAIVCANSLLLFFFLFEMTTLASYQLIAFRNDEISRANALRALWMNQIGGVVILAGTLVAALVLDTVMLDTLLQHSGGMLLFSVALLSMAALVKGASIPFDGWLLGAMVAPTPVSAMLHSATMVKIAPYLILKLAPVLGTTLLGGVLSITGALVFVAAAYLALSRSIFKEILGYSTVALLGLMMALAAIGTKESMMLSMVLMLFHALSKALLFLAAGVLEKQYHLKSIEEMSALVHRAPKTVGFIVLGFVSLTLPPFGLFMGKLFAITSVASLLRERPLLLIVLVSMIIGSTLLVLLYFKVSSALLSNPSDTVRTEKERIPQGFSIPLVLLSLLILFAAVGFIVIQHDVLLALFTLPLLFVFALPSMIRSMEHYDRTAIYHCGEKESFDAALVYYEPSVRIKGMIYWGFGILFVAVAFVGVLS